MAPITVHVVEDNTVLYTVAGTLAGVALGGFLAWLQQRSKIGADKAQLDDRLAAEKVRLGEQLKHDRDMRERESLREVLDIALEAARVQIIQIGQAAEQGNFGVELPPSGVGLAGSKLLIRLGRTHPVQERYRELRDALKSTRELVERPLGGVDSATRRLETGSSHKRAVNAMKAFGDSAASLVGTSFTATSDHPTLAVDDKTAPDMAWD